MQISLANCPEAFETHFQVVETNCEIGNRVRPSLVADRTGLHTRRLIRRDNRRSDDDTYAGIFHDPSDGSYVL